MSMLSTTGTRHRQAGGRRRGVRAPAWSGPRRWAALALALGAAAPGWADNREAYLARAARTDAQTFERLDADRDGRLLRSEVGSDIDWQARFDRIDVDRDGVITRAELERYVQAAYGVAPASR